jgi:hypothetical protein
LDVSRDVEVHARNLRPSAARQGGA